MAGKQSLPSVNPGKHGWLSFCAYPTAYERQDTFRRLFAGLDPVPFQQCFLNWVKFPRSKGYGAENFALLRRKAR